MSEGRDFSIVHRINEHFKDLKEDVSAIGSGTEFSNSNSKRRAALFDFLQIGELSHQLSKPFLTAFANDDIGRLISIRNRIVHGYSTIRDDLVFNTIKNDLPRLIDTLNQFARSYYAARLKGLLGKRIKVRIDRPVGFNHQGIEYRLNYGYYEGLTALDGEFQDVYVLGASEPLDESFGMAIAIIERLDDVEDKLVISTTGNNYADEEIEAQIFFQEQYFKHRISR